MEQLELFQDEQYRKLGTFIEREGDSLLIPEGLHTIPFTHGLHRFAGKFIPNLARYLIREFIPDFSERTILDPFCGSGTTLLEASLEGRKFVGLDIDPLSVAISNAKIQPLSYAEIQHIQKYWEGHDFSQFHPEVVPNVPNLGHWFQEKTVVQLSSIKYRCLELPPNLRLFNLIVFSSIIRRVSNADDQTQKTYVSHTLEKTPPLPSSIFPIFLNRALDGMREYVKYLPGSPRGFVRQGDAVDDIKLLQFDDVITSPPYIDSIDYVYNQMLEYFWLLEELGFKTYDDYRAMRKRPMGFRTFDKALIEDVLRHFLLDKKDKLEQICERIGAKSPKEELAVRSFFYDYANHVSRVRPLQPKDGVYICIVGNSVIRGVTVPTVDFVEYIHTNTGYELIGKLAYEIRRHYMKFPRRSNSGKIKQDHILIFRSTS
jgi:hypothetical protein